VLSVIIDRCSIFLAMNLESIVNSLLIPNKLQYLSMNELGVVEHNSDCNSALRSIFDNMEIAIEQPFVALPLSNLNISAISCAVLGHPFKRHEI
jgi:hypothetical protein